MIIEGKIMQKIAEFFMFCWGSLLDIIFPGPSSCCSCGRLLKECSSIMLCPQCLKELEGLSGAYMEAGEFLPLEIRTENNEKAFDYIGSCYRYEGSARVMVKGLKYKGRTYAARTMANLMAKKLNSREESFDIIVPVPVHPEKKKQRGYNQAELISRELSCIMNKPLRCTLEKRRNTPSQVTLDEKGRWENVREAFILNGDVEGLSVLLVDDVITTGATMYFCACQLKSGGARSVMSFAFAMA